MDAVYLYKHTSSPELAYSVRLLKKFYPELGKIWVVGDKPPVALEKDVIHMQHRTGLSKWADQLDKVRLMSFCPALSDSFVIFNDDFFVTSRFTPKMYIHKEFPSLSQLVSNRSPDPYAASVTETIDFLEENGLPTYNFELHLPMRLDKMLAASLMANVPIGSNLQVRSLYGNSYLTALDGAHYDVKNIKVEDIKDYLSTSNVKFPKYKSTLDKLL